MIPVLFVISVNIRSLVALNVVRFVKVMAGCSDIMFNPEDASKKQHKMPGIRNMARTMLSERVFGTSFMTDIISIKREEYATNPYTPNSRMLISGNTFF